MAIMCAGWLPSFFIANELYSILLLNVVVVVVLFSLMASFVIRWNLIITRSSHCFSLSVMSRCVNDCRQ